MGYFSNGTEGAMYEEEYCVHCVHDINGDCPVLLAHLIYNYDHCNKEDSILHMLIPRVKGPPYNEKCKMFYPKKESDGDESHPRRDPEEAKEV